MESKQYNRNLGLIGAGYWGKNLAVNTGRYNWQGAGENNTAAICGGGYTGTANSANSELWLSLIHI